VRDVPIESPRTPLFAEELRLVVSRSYGPGRYDPVYEERGIDYPAAYVRWTEGRNLEEVLRLMAVGSLQPERLTTHRFALDDAARAYGLLGGSEPSLGIVLEYPGRDGHGPRGRTDRRTTATQAAAPWSSADRRDRGGRVRAHRAASGAGEARGCRSGRDGYGPSGHATAQRFGAAVVGTDPALVLESADLDAVVIATRHDTHAEYVTCALDAGKHVFVEKPLALDYGELAAVQAAAERTDRVLMVGFNRRHAPLAIPMRDELGGAPMLVHYRVNAGRLPRSHWTHDPLVGGGRIVGEMCHFVDFATFLAGGAPQARGAVAVESSSEPRKDTVAATLTFSDGSIATIGYSALGDPGLGSGPALVVRAIAEDAERAGARGELDRLIYQDLRLRPPELLLIRVDKLTMANSIEARVPFLDHELVELAMAMPDAQKIADGVGKVVLKRAVGDLLPHDLVWRPKQGFGAPVAQWFRDELGGRLLAQLDGSAIHELGFLDRERIRTLAAQHASGRADRSFQLWNLLKPVGA